MAILGIGMFCAAHNSDVDIQEDGVVPEEMIENITLLQEGKSSYPVSRVAPRSVTPRSFLVLIESTKLFRVLRPCERYTTCSDAARRRLRGEGRWERGGSG